jgi:hypothetical protein
MPNNHNLCAAGAFAEAAAFAVAVAYALGVIPNPALAGEGPAVCL